MDSGVKGEGRLRGKSRSGRLLDTDWIGVGKIDFKFFPSLPYKEIYAETPEEDFNPILT